MAVFYVRHGESKSNVEGVFAGGKNDTPLTGLGINQAYEAGLSLKNSDISRVICSPLSRTVEAAEIIADTIGLDANAIELDERFAEYDVGAGVGRQIKGTTSAELVNISGAENPDLFAQRVRSALQYVSTADNNILIVSHGGVGRVIECLRTETDPSEFLDLPGYPNATAIELDISWL
jgi:broad specificity phosphatase PhoE